MKKNLVLLGMPGSGKSSLGKLLAKITGLKLYDIDKLIIEEIGLEIAEIFQTKGEDCTQSMESTARKTRHGMKLQNNYINKIMMMMFNPIYRLYLYILFLLSHKNLSSF